MRRLALVLLLAVVSAWSCAQAAQASFGLKDLDVTYSTAESTTADQAGSHPYEVSTSIALNTEPAPPPRGEVLAGTLKDVTIQQIPGFVGNPTATPRCTTTEFQKTDPIASGPACPVASQVGTAEANVQGTEVKVPVYNLVPPFGVVAKLGFAPLNEHVTVEIHVNPDPPHNLLATVSNLATFKPIFSSVVNLWGLPGDPTHDPQRKGAGCVTNCTVNIANTPFITMPRACQGPLQTLFKADSWQAPGVWSEYSVSSHDDANPPNPQGMIGCERLGFSTSITAKPTSLAASSPTGLDFSLDVQDEGLTNPEGLAGSDVKKAVVTLPEGFSANPSLAEGLNICSEADLKRERPQSDPGAGCPNASKIGTVEVETPLLEESVDGSLYVAAPYENPFGSLLALYVVLKNPTLGISIAQPLEVIPDPVTGRLTTVGEELPQLPFSHFRLHFREGTRSPLASPPGCGTYNAKAVLTPWSGGAPVETSSAFQIITGPNAAPCPAAGTPPFHPGLIAGSINNAAGAYSPFNVRLSRTDSEQEITHFSIKLPPGITGKLAGIPFCPDASIAAAKARERQPHGGQEEIDSPSCPAASEIGHTLVGSGVGPSLTYVPGKVYLAGPYKGSPLSLVAITAAKAGPFDLGTVVVREALRINPETAEVFIDATGSDPIPHIVNGIPVHLRDIRVYTDRPDFVLNPTSCSPTSTASTVLGSGTDFASEADDQPVTVATRYQAADCASLPYEPSIGLKLKGGTKRGANPAFRAILRPRPGDANSRKISVALPHSEFLDQEHIKTICTRVQFKAGAGNGAACPAGSVYGHAKAWTPLLSEPLEGPIFLRSSEHPLPDLVLALHGLVDFTAVGRIDSINGGIRNTFEAIPDAPITKVEVSLPGGKKSLLVNSTNVCLGKHKATVEYGAQSGKQTEAKVPLQAQCKGKARKKKHKAKSRRVSPSPFGRLGAW